MAQETSAEDPYWREMRQMAEAVTTREQKVATEPEDCTPPNSPKLGQGVPSFDERTRNMMKKFDPAEYICGENSQPWVVNRFRGGVVSDLLPDDRSVFLKAQHGDPLLRNYDTSLDEYERRLAATATGGSVPVLAAPAVGLPRVDDLGLLLLETPPGGGGMDTMLHSMPRQGNSDSMASDGDARLAALPEPEPSESP
jgi:hypothetical protein